MFWYKRILFCLRSPLYCSRRSRNNRYVHRDQTECHLTDRKLSISTQARGRQIALEGELPKWFCSILLWHWNRELGWQVFLAHVKAALLKMPREEISKGISFHQFHRGDVAFLPFSRNRHLTRSRKRLYGFCSNYALSIWHKSIIQQAETIRPQIVL